MVRVVVRRPERGENFDSPTKWILPRQQSWHSGGQFEPAPVLVCSQKMHLNHIHAYGANGSLVIMPWASDGKN